MLTIFTTLKLRNMTFSGNVQRNAIQSWMALDLPCQILLLGNDEGTAEIAAEYGLHHEPNIARIGDSPPLIIERSAARWQRIGIKNRMSNIGFIPLSPHG